MESKSVFQKVKPLIDHNKNILIPQKEAYAAAIAHYNEFPEEENKETLIVMPTGSGKTGLISILPFGLSNKKVLIITPGKIVRKTVFNELDSFHNPENTFWYKQKIILDREQFPKTYMYTGNFNSDDEISSENMKIKLEKADIIVTNIHKIVASKEEKNLSTLLDQDSFDLIIVDEAHHVAADMWQEALNHFKAAKIIKLTATPFRSDKQDITQNKYDPIYEYTLSEAIEAGLVKDIVKQVEIPHKLELIDTKTNRKYTLSEAKKELGDDWVSKTIAMSKECSKQVIDYTKDVLLKKRKSYLKHQVLAITCNKEHAMDVTQWFNEAGLKATYVYSKMDEVEIERRLHDFKNGEYDVMVSIQMLGEGYDNPNISIISLFRPFKTLSPYAQAIGRGLRRIREENINDIDNFCNVVYHKELNLDKLWDYYKQQKDYGSILKKQANEIYEQLSLFSFDEVGYVEKTPVTNSTGKSNEKDQVGSVRVTSGKVREYISKGFDELDGFSKSGAINYQESLYKITAKVQDELSQKLSDLNNLVTNNLISNEDAFHLRKKYELEQQNKTDEIFNSFSDLYLLEKLNKDFGKWMNNKIEEFFKLSELSKEGYELHLYGNKIDNDKINNIGYIVKNFRVEMFNMTKKNFRNYNKNDFAHAKTVLLQKLDFYTKQFGVIKEGKDDEL